MKLFLTLTILSSLLSMPAFASVGQSETDCPMMSESNSRRNTKADLNNGTKSSSSKKTKIKSV